MVKAESSFGIRKEISRAESEKEVQKDLAVEVFSEDSAISEAARSNLRNHFEIEKDEDILALALEHSFFKFTAELCKTFVEQPSNKIILAELSTRGMKNDSNIKKIGQLLIKYEGRKNSKFNKSVI